MNDATDVVDTLLYWSTNPNYTIFNTVWSIRRELAKNENQKWQPNQWNQCVGVMNDGTDAVDTMMHSAFQWQFYHHRHHRIHTEKTSQEREAGANYNRNDSQISEISELESWMMLQMLSTLCCTDRPIQIIPLSSPSDLYGENEPKTRSRGQLQQKWQPN